MLNGVASQVENPGGKQGWFRASSRLLNPLAHLSKKNATR
jgi:hypothetical protein